MDPELKHRLDEMHALIRENHRMLRAVRRDHWIAVMYRVSIWVVLIIVPLIFFRYYLQPLMARFAVPGQPTSANLLTLPSSTELQKLLNSFKAAQ